MTGNQKLTQQAGLVQSATDAAKQLTEVSFDQMNLNIERLSNGDVILSDLSLIAPALRLVGEGQITYRTGLDFWMQPLEINLSLSARDDFGVSLAKLGLLRGEADSLGYLPLVSGFTLDGSLDNIGTTQLEQLLMRAFR